METLFFLFAILCICIAHLIRVRRWRLFIEIYEKPYNRNLIQALSIGYLLNYVIPYKLGDIVRAWISGRKMKNGRALGFSTVIVDRYLDIVMVGIIFVILRVSGNQNSMIRQSTLFYATTAGALLLLAALIYVFRGLLKRWISVFAGVFNKRIETSILKCAWALIWNFKDIFLKINKWKLLLTTLGMWICYLLSYYFFGAFLSAHGQNCSWIDVFTLLFTENGIKSSTSSLGLWSNPYYMTAYMILPLIIMMLLSFLFRSVKGEDSSEEYLNLLPHLDPEERLDFLENYFSGRNKEYVTNYLNTNRDISIIRDYSAGSNATTMLCTDGRNTFFRKYAFGQDGDKLYDQINWIENYKDVLALPDILKQGKDDLCCYYDMPYSVNAVGMFEYVHSMPIEHSWNMIQRVLESLENSIYVLEVHLGDRDTLCDYIRNKVTKNLETIRNAGGIKRLEKYPELVINGVKYRNLSCYEKYLTEEYLLQIFEQDSCAVIHGDLTIENIICKRTEGEQDDFYIIDPNTGNIHNSPNLDYAKLLQSIHGGYEFLMSTRNVSVSGNRIDFLFTKSQVYSELHSMLQTYLTEKFGEKTTRSIYFHEMIHWLRLMPYKLEKDENRALIFYAGMLMVMNDVITMYGDAEDE